MADPKDIEIKLKASGGDAAAKEVGKVTEANEELAASTSEVSESSVDLDKAQGDLKDRFAETRSKIDEMRKATTDAAEAVGPKPSGLAGRVSALGGRLLALAGGPIPVIVGAVGALISLFVKTRQTLAEVDETAAAGFESMGSAIDALNMDEAAAGASTLADEVSRLTDRQSEANESFLVAAERLDRLKDAQATLTKAQIAHDVATGKITADEARIKKAELEMEISQRKVDLQVELAASQKETAAAAARNAADAVRIAEAELAAAREKEKLRLAEVQRPLVDARTKQLSASAIGDLGALDKNAGRKAIDLAGGADEVRRMIAEMTGLAGFNARAGAAAGLDLEQILGPMERAALAKVMADEAEMEGEAAAAAAKEVQKLNADIVAEKAAQLKAMEKTRLAAEQEAAAAEAALAAAENEKMLTEQFLLPAAALGIETGNVDAARREQARADADRARTGKDVDRGALDLAKDIQGQIAAAPNAAGNPELIAALQGIAGVLGDGTDANELATVAAQLSSLMGGLTSEQVAARAKLSEASRRIADLEAQLRNNR